MNEGQTEKGHIVSANIIHRLILLKVERVCLVRRLVSKSLTISKNEEMKSWRRRDTKQSLIQPATISKGLVLLKVERICLLRGRLDSVGS